MRQVKQTMGEQWKKSRGGNGGWKTRQGHNGLESSSVSDGKIGRRPWKMTSDGTNRSRGGGVWGSRSDCEKSALRAKGNGTRREGASSLITGDCVKGSMRRELLRRRTGPGPRDGVCSSIAVSRRERSAMSHGLEASGSMDSAEIQGRSSRDVRGREVVLIQQSARAQWR